MDTYEWLPTECADERYPMQLVSGHLHCAGDQSIRIPSGKIVNNGWGEVGSRHIVGDAQKPVPEQLSLAYFSYTEDQFFAGEVELPHAELARMFQAGLRDPLNGQLLQWDKLIVGMGLGGWICVWLSGSGHVREVFSTKLEPAELDWKRVVDNPNITRANFVGSKLRSRLTDADLRMLAERGPPAPTWQRHSQRYRWRIIVEGVQVPLNMGMRCFNGEHWTYEFARQPPGELSTVPKSMFIIWRTRHDWKLLTKIRFDEREMFAAHDKAAASASDAALPSMRIELAARSQIAITLEHADGKIPLRGAQVEFLRVPGG